MPFLLRPRLASDYLKNGDVVEVVDVFDHLFEVTRREWLPNRIIVTPLNSEAGFRSMRDTVPQWEDQRLPKDQRITYEEVQEIEAIALFYALASSDQSALCLPFEGPNVCDAFAARLPLVLHPFAHWILGDFQILLQKRFAWGTRPGILEDLFQAYRAGYFVYGWTGTYPNDIRLLACQGRDG